MRSVRGAGSPVECRLPVPRAAGSKGGTVPKEAVPSRFMGEFDPLVNHMKERERV